MPQRVNFHNEAVEAIMRNPPSWLVRWGISVMLCIVVGIFWGCYLIKSPDIIISPVEITTYNPPIDLISKSEGLIDTLFVGDGMLVEKEDFIAILHSSANWKEVRFVSEKLVSFFSQGRDSLDCSWISNNYNLGEIQSAFISFQKNYKEYDSYIKNRHNSQKGKLLNQQIDKSKEYLLKQYKQYSTLVDDLKLQIKSFKRDSLLFSNRVISAVDYELALQNLIQKKSAESGFNAILSQTELQIIQLEHNLIELSMQSENERSEYERILIRDYQKLVSEIARWEDIYTIKAPISGRVSYTNYWKGNQHIGVGDKLLSIIPQDKAYLIGRIQISSSRFGKVKIGQSVNVKLNAYPYMEFGVLRGRIISLSAVPEQVMTVQGVSIVYIAQITFSSNLRTSYGIELPMIQRMDGVAEIITEDMRLLSRFFHPIISLFKNR